MKQVLLILITAALLSGLILVGETHILEPEESDSVTVLQSQLPVQTAGQEGSSSSPAEYQSEPESSSSAGNGEASSFHSEPQAGSEPESSSKEPEEEKPDPTQDWRLMLINAEHLLPEDYDFEKTVIEDNYSFDSRAAEALIQMLSDGRAAGYSLRIVSTYRTVERSEYLYNRKIGEYQSIGYSEADAAVEAAKWVAPPRQSEHNAGLAIDVVSRDYDQVYGDLMHEFENFPAFTWLSEHCAEYGFVLRYPEDKQEITGITYEPWHYRYVGVEHAQKMQELNMCLEEYWEYLQS